MKKVTFFGVVLMTMMLLLVGCADSSVYTLVEPIGHTYGFWGGVWHGMIMVPDFIGSLIWDDVAVYAVNNNGNWYNFGFVGGLGFGIKLIVNLLKLIRTLL